MDMVERARAVAVRLADRATAADRARELLFLRQWETFTVRACSLWRAPESKVGPTQT